MKDILKTIAETIKGTQFRNRTYAVGGFVRDHVMGKTSSDLDIVVELDNGGMELAEFLYERGISSRPVIFKNFGTAFVLIENRKIEFVMTRKESYRDKNRKPEVEAGSLKEDVFRRDFTINSLVMNVGTGEIADITGFGISDIKNKNIRSTSNPEIIFSEDPLRMLRAVRFAVQLDFKIETKTEKGIRDNHDKLNFISWERRRDEFIKIITLPKPRKGLKMLISFGLMKNLIPELLELEDVTQNKYHDDDVWEHTLKTLHNSGKDLVVRLAALLHDIAKPQTRSSDENGVHFYRHESIGAELSKKILSRLKFPAKISSQVACIIRNHVRLKQFGDDLKDMSDKAVRRLVMDMGDDLESFLQLVHADNISHAPGHCLHNQGYNLRKRIALVPKKIIEKKLPVSGKDIMLHFGLDEGKKIGILMNRVKEIWLEYPDWSKEKILNSIKPEEEKW
ncbi:MAG: HDIG domain-containing protein [Candidatus Cloacimonetes bacterium]|nr:HDIG domain-containing protein [Candidatus Cloacimonadota bacterium]